MPDNICVEVCLESMHSARIAEQEGADRLELNSALALGGLTPTIEQLRQIKSNVKLPVVCMVRPRPGDFYYSDSEFELMQQEARALMAAGANGLAVGFLDADGNVDQTRLNQFREICDDRDLVFHRAFDCTANLDVAAEVLIESKVDRVLTSGGVSTAIQGQATIADLQDRYGKQIEILPGSGINSSNVVDFLKATGCKQVHGTFRVIEKTGSRYSASVNFNEVLGIAADEKFESSADEIRRMVEMVR